MRHHRRPPLQHGELHKRPIIAGRGRTLCEASISRIVEMAWEDRTTFEAIEAQFGLNESAVIALMRRYMLPSSFRMWRKRMAGRRTKHAMLRGAQLLRHRATHRRQ